MCQVFVSADPQLYAHRARSVRLHGVATSIRLETLFWQVLEEIATRDGYTVPQLCTRLYDELIAERGAIDNFTAFLRVCCTRYLALQLSGHIPQDTRIPIRSIGAPHADDSPHLPKRPSAHPALHAAAPTGLARH